MSSRLVWRPHAALAAGRAPDGIGDQQFDILATDRLGGQHLLDRHGHELAHVGARHHHAQLLGHGKRRGRSRRKQDQTGQALGTARRQELNRFTAHGVADQDVALQAKGLDHALGVVGELRQTVAAGRMIGRAPAALIDRHGPVAEREGGYDVLPGAGGGAPAMQEDDGQCAFALVRHMKADAIGCDVHGKAILQSLDRPLAASI